MKENSKKILVVDDNRNTAEIIKRNLELENYYVFTGHSVEEALKLLGNENPDLVITDNKMPKKSGIELVRYVRDHFPEIPIIMITGYSSINGAVLAVKEGVDEYLPKPFSDIELSNVVKKVFQHYKYSKFNTNSLNNYWKSFGIIGESDCILKLFHIIEKTCTTEANILITGECGTGKELIARAIHYSHKSRALSPFITVNCPGIPENLFESELFGHTKGAFGGAIETKKGFLRAADKGSIYLDEISAIPLPAQDKLVKVIEDKEFYVLGKDKPQKANSRIIAATSRNLEKLVALEQFREDLYFRLNIVNIHIPPLRERGDDIIILANYFLSKYSAYYNKTKPEFTGKAIDALMSYSWPGNVRELENLIQQCVIIHDKLKIDRSDFPDKMKYKISFTDNTVKPLAEIEKEYIAKVLEMFNNNKSKAAAVLGIDRRTIREKLK